MVNYGSILLPLYYYPYPLSNWQPIFDAAKNYPQVNFTVVVNPDNGPAPVSNGCPNSDYVSAIAALNSYPNINTMGYVHTASRYNCGPNNNYICPATQPLSAVQKNITTYANWAKLTCTGFGTTKQDVHMDSIFVDEGPGQDNGANLTYMTNVANFARQSGFNSTNSGIVLFNPGGATDLSYFKVADQIIILEDTETAYDSADIGARNGNGTYARKSSAIIHNHTNLTSTIQRDTQTILSLAQDAFASLYITNLPNATTNNTYGGFGTTWNTFVGFVNQTVVANKNFCKTHSCS